MIEIAVLPTAERFSSTHFIRTITDRRKQASKKLGWSGRCGYSYTVSV